MADQPAFRLPRFAVPRRYELDLEPHLAEGGFDGSVTVVVDVVEPTDSLVLNAAGLSITEASLLSPDGSSTSATVRLVPAEQQVVLGLPSTIPPAAGYRLRLSFSGVFDEYLRGFYRSSYRDADGSERVIATTQFQATDARRAFPCWDEPDLKASFVIRLVVDDQLQALSNGPVESVETLPAGRKRVTFAETMVMSTYLVAFIVGPFEMTEPVEVDGVPLRVAALPGRERLTGFAEEAGTHALGFLSDYFAIPYPASKIDHVAIPDFAAGAMENLGCVTYRETALLVDPEIAAQVEIQRVATVVAHETAHMWFGDLVTMGWWEGIWLNEAFATFMENLTTDHFRPDWQQWTAFGAGKQAAMVIDALRATRPVEFAVGRPEEADAMFDLLTYQKGGSVLRMLEQYLGPEVFRKGISHYLSAHAYGNTVTKDLWDALETVSGEPVASIMDSWIYQGGFPLISVEADPGGTELVFTQSRFAYNPGSPEATWSVPITLRASVGGKMSDHRFVLDDHEARLSLDGQPDWVVVNDGSWGFYRVRYAPDLRDKLLSRRAISSLSSLERSTLVADTWAAAVAGVGDIAGWARVAEAVDPGDDPDIWTSVSAGLATLESLANEEDRSHLRRFTHRIADPVWESLGWEAPPGEGSRRSTARARVLAVLGLIADDERVAEQASRRFASFVSGATPLAPDLVGVAASIVVSSGSAPEWSKVLELYRSGSTPQEMMRYLDALAETRDPGLQKRTLDMCLADEVRSQDAPFIIRHVLTQRSASALAWGWIEDRWEDLTSRFAPSLLARSLEGIATICDAGLADRVNRFCAEREMPLAGPRLDQLLERMQVNVALAERSRGTLSTSLGV